MKTFTYLSLILAFFLSAPMHAQEKPKVFVTVYNNNLGVIRDIREMDLKSGPSIVKITDVAQYIDPTTVHFKFNGTVIEQNYQFDLVSLEKILSRYVDKEIQLISEKGELVTGKLLSVAGGQVVLQKKDGGLLLLPSLAQYRLSVDALPEGLITRPTLLCNMLVHNSGLQDVEMSYQTAGMEWHAEYVAVLDKDDRKMDIKAWVSVQNNSGTTYHDAMLKLVAGDVNRVTDNNTRYAKVEMQTADASGGEFTEKSFFEYHIYHLQRPATLANNEIKQLSLFEAPGVPIVKKYIYRNNNYSGEKKVEVVVETDNTLANNMGMPIPAGKVRMYKEDGTSLEFIGEDRVTHTPKDEKLAFKVGDAFDIAVEDIQTDYKKVSDRVNDYSFKVTLRNRKTEDIVVEVQRTLGLGWEMLSNSHPFEKKSAQEAAFKIPVKAGKESVLTFTVRYSY